MVHNELALSKHISPKFLKNFTFSFEKHLSMMTRLSKLSATSKASKAYFMSELDGKLAKIAMVNREGTLPALRTVHHVASSRAQPPYVRLPYRSEIDGVVADEVQLREEAHGRSLAETGREDRRRPSSSLATTSCTPSSFLRCRDHCVCGGTRWGFTMQAFAPY